MFKNIRNFEFENPVKALIIISLIVGVVFGVLASVFTKITLIVLCIIVLIFGLAIWRINYINNQNMRNL